MCRKFLAILVGVMVFTACAADPVADGTTRGGRSGAGGNDGFGNAASGGTAGAGSIPDGQTTGRPDQAPPVAGSGPIGDECIATGAEAEVGREPADIVWLVDNSCSMAVEAVAVQTNMNRFAQQLLDNGIDVHLVLISSASTGYQMNAACPPSSGRRNGWKNRRNRCRRRLARISRR